jgi:hypothetical protein
LKSTLKNQPMLFNHEIGAKLSVFCQSNFKNIAGCTFLSSEWYCLTGTPSACHDVPRNRWLWTSRYLDSHRSEWTHLWCCKISLSWNAYWRCGWE